MNFASCKKLTSSAIWANILPYIICGQYTISEMCSFEPYRGTGVCVFNGAGSELSQLNFTPLTSVQLTVWNNNIRSWITHIWVTQAMDHSANWLSKNMFHHVTTGMLIHLHRWTLLSLPSERSELCADCSHHVVYVVLCVYRQFYRAPWVTDVNMDRPRDMPTGSWLRLIQAPGPTFSKLLTTIMDNICINSHCSGWPMWLCDAPTESIPTAGINKVIRS